MPEKSPLPANIAHSRAVQLLRNLNKQEIRLVQSFAQGEYFCKDARVCTLLCALAKQYPDFPEKLLDKPKLFARLFKDERFSTLTMNGLLSKVIELIERFIAVRELERDPLQQHQYLAQRAATTHDERFFEGSVNGFAKAYADAPESLDKLHQRFRLRQIQWAHWASVRHQPDPQAFRQLQAAQRDYCRTAQLILACEEKLRTHFLSDKKTGHYAEPTSPLLQLWEKLYMLTAVAGPDEAAFKDCLHHFYACFGQLDAETRGDALACMLNYCNHYSKTDPVYRQHLSAMFSWALQQSPAFLEKWLRSEDTYLNIALALGQAHELVRMEDFIQSKTIYLPPSARRDARALAYAYFLYFKKEFSAAGEHIKKVLAKGRYKYGLRLHSLNLRLKYEQSIEDADLENVADTLHTYQTYFKRNDDALAPERLAAYLGLHEFVSTLIKVRDKKLSLSREQILNLLETRHPVPIADGWIRTQILSL